MITARGGRPAIVVFIASLVVFFVLAAVVAPWAARAASINYWDADLGVGMWRSSSPGSIYGGEIQADPAGGYGSISVKVQTQNAYGYIYYTATGGAYAAMTHATVANTQSACHFTNPTGGTSSTFVACWKYQ